MEAGEGYLKGDLCNRDGCTGIIDEHEKEGCCSCHINPPCSYCVEDAAFCPDCNWEGIEEQRSINTPNPEMLERYRKDIQMWEEQRQAFNKLYHSTEPVSKLDYRTEAHTHFSQKVFGVFPVSESRENILYKVRGTFGGRFTRFDSTIGRFEYIAYTD